MRKKKFFYGLSIAVLAAVGYMVDGYSSSNAVASSTLTLSNLDALSNPENSETSGSETGTGSESGTGTESGSNIGSGSSYDFPDGRVYRTTCNMETGQGTFGPTKCKVSIINCESGGAGCNLQDCPAHPRFKK